MTLPPEGTLRDLVQGYAEILAAAGDVWEGAELVTPTAEHFPDRFERDGESLGRLLRRLISYSPLDDGLGVQIALVEDGEEAAGGCGTGACATSCAPGGAARLDGVAHVGSGYRLPLAMADTGTPARMVASLARGVGAMILAEAGEEPDASEVGVRSELAAAASGMGLLLLAASHVYQKSCGGVHVHQGTALGVAETAVLVALFCGQHEIRPARARAHMEATQREAFDEAWAWMESNRELARALREEPESVAEGAFKLARPRGWLSRIFSSRGSKDDAPPLPAAPPAARPRDPEQERRLAEARALVEEAFASPDGE